MLRAANPAARIKTWPMRTACGSAKLKMLPLRICGHDALSDTRRSCRRATGASGILPQAGAQGTDYEWFGGTKERGASIRCRRREDEPDCHRCDGGRRRGSVGPSAPRFRMSDCAVVAAAERGLDGEGPEEIKQGSSQAQGLKA